MTGFSLAALTAMTLFSHASYDDAYKSAVEDERPLVVLIGAQWCSHCHVMKSHVDTQMAAGDTAERVAFAYVDLDRQPALARRLMSGDTVPQLVLYHKEDSGWKKRNLVGSQSGTTVRQFIEQSFSQ